MKKLITLILLLSLSLSLASCGGEGNNTTKAKDTTDSPVSTDTPIEDGKDTENTADTPPATDPVTDPVTTEAPKKTVILKETLNAGDEYLKKIIFMGDSTTYGLMAYGVLEGGRDTKQVWTPAARTCNLVEMGNLKILLPGDDAETPYVDALKKEKPEVIVITLGINYSPDYNSGWDEERKKTYFINQINTLVKNTRESSPETVIVLQSIYPTVNGVSNVDNETIDRRNAWLLEAAEANEVYYLDTQSVMRGDDGGLVPSYCGSTDGIHLGHAGFAVVLDYIKTHSVFAQ